MVALLFFTGALLLVITISGDQPISTLRIHRSQDFIDWRQHYLLLKIILGGAALLVVPVYVINPCTKCESWHTAFSHSSRGRRYLAEMAQKDLKKVSDESFWPK